ncbi:MAG: hypothetical protein OXS32_12620 [Verrucomicrobiales bacterium]|nr:hypothetical protein [Verrucomicrobiales bacterium]
MCSILLAKRSRRLAGEDAKNRQSQQANVSGTDFGLHSVVSKLRTQIIAAWQE